MNRILLLMLLFVSLAAHTAQADAVDDYVKSEMKRLRIPAVSVAVIRNGKVVKTAGYGTANLELGVSATSDTVYEIGSLTKQFTAVAVLMLMEEGRLSLDDPLSRHLEGIPDSWKELTILHLLQHTSGVPNFTATTGFAWTKRYKPSEIFDLVRDRPLEFSQGERYAYSNTGYFLLGEVIGKITGMPWHRFLQERVFEPLGMSHTQANDIIRLIRRRAAGYVYAGVGHVHGDPILPESAGAAGALVSNVIDLAKWDAALTKRVLPLKPQNYRSLWTPARLLNGSRSSYGLGFVAAVESGHQVIEHAGGTGGFSSHSIRYPEHNLSVILLTNRAGVNTGPLARGIAHRVLPVLKPRPPASVPDPDPRLTGRTRTILQTLIDEEADSALFTKDMWDVIQGPQGRAAFGPLKSLGPVSSFKYSGHQVSGEWATSQYRVAFGETVLLMVVTRNKEGIIAGLYLRPE